MSDKFVSITVDVEPDCPPFLNTFQGIEKGIPLLLDLFKAHAVKSTFFVTGKIAERFPEVIKNIVDGGHELGSHGHTHRSFQTMTLDEAAEEIKTSSEILRRYSPVTSFRAPYLSFPAEFLPLLTAHHYTLDSSATRYKRPRGNREKKNPLARIPVSLTSSALRLPKVIREILFRSLTEPAVLFVHPWEFVDFRKSNLRLDCRFKTGAPALACLESVILFYQRRHFQCVTLGDLGKKLKMV